ncbi:MAG: DUF917 domain-containing protein [Chlamydiales bacterium]
MTSFELRTHQDIIDFTTGCCFFGTGGGGDPKIGEQLLQDVLSAGKKIRIVDSSELQDETSTICPFLMGSSGPDTLALQQTRKFYGLIQKTVSNMSEAAARLLLTQAKVKLGAVVPIEIGGAATASAVATAAWLDVPTLDGDYAGGRSLPEISQFLPAINGLKYCPLVSVDAYDNQVYILQATNSLMEERLGKLVASASYSLAGQAGLLLPYKKVRSCIEYGTLYRAFCLGKALREAKTQGQDMIQCVTKTINAQLIISGKIVEINGTEKENYYIGEHIIAGEGDFHPHRVKIWFKNEYLQLWWNGRPYVLSPDFICIVSYLTGRPMINSQVKQGDQVAIFAIPAPSLLVSKNALKFLDPRYFGFDFDYASFSTQHR